MPAYWIAQVDITDPAAYKGYADRAPAALQKYGGKFLARGGRRQRIEGPEPKSRVVVLEFPSIERAMEAYNSPEYREAMSFRANAADAQIFVVESL
ncbi:MAG: DUF1330 domain-containing protein [Alphaproteobacteria bacterium]|nr:DUF1330 domain-containing protein [Alphaproteobacteria bacterium]